MKYTNKLLTALLLLAPAFVFFSCDVDEEQTVVNNFNNLVFADEFDVDGAPDSSIWTYDIGTGVNGWGNNELQYYTDRAENVKVQNGYLMITATQESYEGSAYTSAKLLTKGLVEQQYGRFEARMRLPYGQGMWPAFWMLGNDVDSNTWPACGEIDIMENRGSAPAAVAGSLHGPGYSGGTPITKEYDFENSRVDTDFHVYGVEWTADYINFYVDNALYNQITRADVEEKGEWVFDHPFFMILNLAVGGDYGGNPNANTVFPQTMLVDYVRVYQ